MGFQFGVVRARIWARFREKVRDENEIWGGGAMSPKKCLVDSDDFHSFLVFF